MWLKFQLVIIILFLIIDVFQEKKKEHESILKFGETSEMMHYYSCSGLCSVRDYVSDFVVIVKSIVEPVMYRLYGLSDNRICSRLEAIYGRFCWRGYSRYIVSDYSYFVKTGSFADC